MTIKQNWWRTFAVQLFGTEDADPGYMMLARVDWPVRQKYRFLVAWCTYYHPGIAAHASMYEGSGFWNVLASYYQTAPRASERRHFRGAAGRFALGWWAKHYPDPEDMIVSLQGSTYFKVKELAKSVPQIGPYFVWKLADIQERVFRIPCDFTGAEQHSPKVPREGSKLIAPSGSVAQAYSMIAKHLRDTLGDAPPWYDRPYNMQEAETVCCVYHQYVNDKYWPKSRTAKAALRLLAYPSQAATELHQALRGNERGSKWSQKDERAWAEAVMNRVKPRA